MKKRICGSQALRKTGGGEEEERGKRENHHLET
jgi:hypothetical protein